MKSRRPPSSSGPHRGKNSVSISITGCASAFAKTIRSAVVYTLRKHDRLRGSLSISLVSDAQMRRAHHEWMGIDSPTDVLTFDLRDHKDADSIEGEVMVCQPVAQREARIHHTSEQAELLLYIIHGCLHLSGFEDKTRIGFDRMHQEEDTILAALGWGPVFSASRYQDPGKRAIPERRTPSGSVKRQRAVTRSKN